MLRGDDDVVCVELLIFPRFILFHELKNLCKARRESNQDVRLLGQAFVGCTVQSLWAVNYHLANEA
jgi:hypothetical protein